MSNNVVVSEGRLLCCGYRVLETRERERELTRLREQSLPVCSILNNLLHSCSTWFAGLLYLLGKKRNRGLLRHPRGLLQPHWRVIAVSESLIAQSIAISALARSKLSIAEMKFEPLIADQQLDAALQKIPR